MIRRIGTPKTESYEVYVEDCINDNTVPQKREEFDNDMRESLKEEFPTREIEGQIIIHERDGTKRTEEAWYHWDYDYNHFCDCEYCNDETELIY